MLTNVVPTILFDLLLFNFGIFFLGRFVGGGSSAQVDKIVHQVFVHISAFELTSMCDFWEHLSRRFFSRLERSFMSSVRKLEVCLKRYYLVNAIQVSGRHRPRMVQFSMWRWWWCWCWWWWWRRSVCAVRVIAGIARPRHRHHSDVQHAVDSFLAWLRNTHGRMVGTTRSMSSLKRLRQSCRTSRSGANGLVRSSLSCWLLAALFLISRARLRTCVRVLMALVAGASRSGTMDGA